MYRSSVFLDPAMIYERKEAKSCKGCVHQYSERAFGTVLFFCKKGRKKQVKCKHYCP